MTADSVPAPMVQLPKSLVHELREAMAKAILPDGNVSHTGMKAVMSAAQPIIYATREAFLADAATPAASVPAADILALAEEWEERAMTCCTLMCQNCGARYIDPDDLRTLVAAAEQADKGEAADTPRDDETIKCPTCGVARGWNEDGRLTRGIWTLNCVRCGSFQIEIEDAPAAPPEPVCRCGHTNPTHGWHANRPCNAHGCPCAQYEPRVPVNDEAEAACAKCGFTRTEHATNPYRCTGFKEADPEKAWREWDNGDHGWENCRDSFIAGYRAAAQAGRQT